MTDGTSGRPRVPRSIVLAAALLAGAALVGVVWFRPGPNERPVARPGAASPATPRVRFAAPDPEACRTSPRSGAALGALAATAAAEGGGTAVNPMETDPAAGVPAPPAVATAVADTFREIVACLNAGDTPRAFALYSDDHVRRLLAADDGAMIRPEILAGFLATPRPVPPTRWTGIGGFGEARLLPDGRVGLIVVTGTPGQAGTEDGAATLAVFVERDGRWLLDAAFPVPGEPPAASPAVPAGSAPPAGTASGAP